MDRPCGSPHLGPAAGPLQPTFPQSEPGPRELRAQAPPPSPATGWLCTKPRPESRALRVARKCELLFCCYYMAFLIFFLTPSVDEVFKALPAADPDLSAPRTEGGPPSGSPSREPPDVPLSKKLAVFGTFLLQAWGPSKDSSKAAGGAPG